MCAVSLVYGMFEKMPDEWYNQKRINLFKTMYGGDISKFVPPYVAGTLKSQFGFVKFGDPAK